MTTPAQPGEDAIRSATRGDPAAIHDVLQAYLPRLQQFVHLRLGPKLRAREDTVDIVQSTVRELLAQPAFEWRGEIEFRAWLFQAALHKILEKQRFHRLGKRDIGREVPATAGAEAAAAIAAGLLTPSLAAIGKETAHQLEDALDALSPDHREVITLARIVRLPHRVVAEVMGRREDAVRQLLVRAMLRLTEELRVRGVEL